MPASEQSAQQGMSMIRRLARQLGLMLGLGFVVCVLMILSGIQHAGDRQGLVPGVTAPAQIFAALQKLSSVERNMLIVREKERLVRAPLDRSALMNLSILSAAENDTKQSDALALLAANRSLRDIAAQISAMGLLFNQKDYAGAFYRLDGVLRAQPERAKELFPIILNAAANEHALDAATDVLIGNPPLRQSFLNFAAGQPDLAQELYKIFSQLRSKKNVVSDGELRPFLQALLHKKEYETAYFVWLDFQSPEYLRKVGLLFDGGFDLRSRNLIYDWNVKAMPNASISIAARPGSNSNLALKLDLAGAKWAYPAVFQYLRLSPGNYALTAESQARVLQTTGGLVWQMTCVESGSMLGRSPKLDSPGPWANFEFSFSVPDKDCTTQTLGLVSASAAALDQVMSGEVFFDSFALNRIN
jgi:hypothetical protein